MRSEEKRIIGAVRFCGGNKLVVWRTGRVTQRICDLGGCPVEQDLIGYQLRDPDGNIVFEGDAFVEPLWSGCDEDRLLRHLLEYLLERKPAVTSRQKAWRRRYKSKAAPWVYRDWVSKRVPWEPRVGRGIAGR